MLSNEPKYEQYQENIKKENWPEARYEWDMVYSRTESGINPFDEVDDKLDELEFIARRHDFTNAYSIIQRIRDSEPGKSGYRQQDWEKYWALIDPVARQLEEMEERKNRGDYQRCLEIIRKLKEKGWRIKEISSFFIENLQQLIKVRTAMQEKEYRLAYSRIREVNVPKIKLVTECLDLWVNTIFALFRSLIDSNNLQLAWNVAEHIDSSDLELVGQQQIEFESLRATCLAQQIKQSKDLLSLLFMNGDLDKAFEKVQELIDTHKTAFNDSWTEFGSIPNDIQDYQKDIETAEYLKNECQFKEALDILLGAPDSLKSCGGTVCSEKIEELRDLVERRQKVESSIKQFRDKFEIARMNRRYWRTCRYAWDLVRLIRATNKNKPRLFKVEEIKSHESEAKIQKKRAFRRAVLALLTGEMLILWLVRRLRGD